MALFADLQAIDDQVRRLKARPKHATSILPDLMRLTSEHENTLRMLQAGLLPLLLKIVVEGEDAANAEAIRSLRCITSALAVRAYDNHDVKAAQQLLITALERHKGCEVLVHQAMAQPWNLRAADTTATLANIAQWSEGGSELVAKCSPLLLENMEALLEFDPTAGGHDGGSAVKLFRWFVKHEERHLHGQNAQLLSRCYTRPSLVERILSSDLCHPARAANAAAALKSPWDMPSAALERVLGSGAGEAAGKLPFTMRLLSLPARASSPSSKARLASQAQRILVSNISYIDFEEGFGRTRAGPGVDSIFALYHLLTLDEWAPPGQAETNGSGAAEALAALPDELLSHARDPLLHLCTHLRSSPYQVMHQFWGGSRTRTRSEVVALLERAISLATLLKVPESAISLSKSQLSSLRAELARSMAEAAAAAAAELRAEAERQAIRDELGIEVATPCEFLWCGLLHGTSLLASYSH